MIVITDSNIIVSALIKPTGHIAQIFKAKSQIQFIAPSFLLTELMRHKQRIMKNSSLSPTDFKKELTWLKTRIQFVDLSKIPKKYIKEAYKIVADIDIDDTFFVALNRYTHHKIWTTDKVLINGLEKKGYKICVTTAMLRLKLYK